MDVRSLYNELFSKELAMVKKAGVAPWLAAAGLLGAGAGIPLAYQYGRKSGEEEETKNRMLAFGAGALSGAVASPALMKLKSSLGLGLTSDSFGGSSSGLSNGFDLSDFTSF